MHATQHPGGACPKPTYRTDPTTEATPGSELAGLLTVADRFRAWIAQAAATATATGLPALTEPAPLSLGEVPHAAEYCHHGGAPHLGPCIEPDAADAPGTAGLVLRLAALYLERHGWIQGAYYDPTATAFTPAACLVGAIGMVCYGGPVEAPAQHFDDPGFLDFEEAMLRLDRYLLVEDGSEAYEFNDARGRRAEDVIAMLRQAAAVPAEELLDALRIVHADDARRARLFGGDAG